MKIFYVFFLILFLPITTQASYIEYCKGTKTTQTEDAVIQRLVPYFGNKMNCEIGENCLAKLDVKGKSEKFSIAWKKQCGPVINGVRQLGDDGHGSTFMCEMKEQNNFCCWPLGYDHVKEFIICSNSIRG